MPLDALCLAAVRDELSARITGQKIEKVYQPERDVLIIKLRGGAGSCRLLISAGSGDMRVHLTESRLENPAAPPMFCMLLRKHLTGARIVGVTQPPSERILELVFDTWDDEGNCTEKRLIVELIGRMSNVILADSKGTIIDCLRRNSDETSEKRTLFPGCVYTSPAPQEGKTAALSITEDSWQQVFDARTGSASADKWLISTFYGLSPLICREISWRAYGDTEYQLSGISDGGASLRREFFSVLQAVSSGEAEPWIITGDDGTPRDFSFTRIMQYETALEVSKETSFSAMLDGYYTRASQIARVRQRASATTKTVRNARDRLVRKIAAQREELDRTTRRDSARECGDIIMANMHLMKKGQSLLTAPDFYAEEGAVREILLDPLKTPQQNAAKYYKEYTKSKNAEKFLTEQVRIGEHEMEYLESVLGAIELAEGERDLEEIRRELVQTGYIKAQKKSKEKPAATVPLKFASSSGFQILAGRNNSQNDKLTHKTAFKSDVWLHVQNIPGAHVIIVCGGAAPDDMTLREAAAIAAYYSSARKGGKAAVDYTQVKYVKKPPGGRPGMVIYTNQSTIIATLDEELVNRLKRNYPL